MRLRIYLALVGLILGCGGGDAPPLAVAPAVVGGGTSTGALNIPLTVTESLGLPRPLEPVTVGVPFPKSAAITDTANLALLDGAASLPAQFRVLSRWDGPATDATLPIRWVLVDSQMSLGAGETRTLTLKNSGSPPAATPLVVDNSAPEFLHVDTGAMQVRIGKQRGNVFDRVTVGGKVVLDDPTPTREHSGIRFVDGNGTVYRSSLTTSPEVVVEEQGPLRATVRIASELTSAAGAVFHPGAVRVLHRIHFYANQAWCRMHSQLENNAVYGDFNSTLNTANVLNFDSLTVELPLALGSDRTFRTAGFQATGNASWRVLQRHSVVNPNDESQNFSYELRQNGSIVATGSRHAGWVDLATPGGGATAAVRWFWQNYEKALGVSSDRVSIELWPSEGSYPSGTLYQFEGGRHKSHEMVLKFYSTLGGDPGADLSRHFAPLLPRAPASWYAQSEALGMMDEGQLIVTGTDDDARMNQAYVRYNDLMKQRVGAVPPDPSRPEPRNLPEARESRFRVGSWATMDWYGWAHFGDAAWGDGYSSNHYDLPGFLLIHFLRLGDRAFWDQAEPHIRQASEWGQYWGIDPNPFVPSISFYEKTQHGIDPDWFRPVPSHNWIRRLILYYWLTGHRAAYDAALFNAEGLWRYFYQAFDISDPASFGFDPNNWSPLSESRFLSWTLDNILEVYALTGDAKWKTMCEDLVKCLLHAYVQAGHLDGAGARSLGDGLMSHYASEPLIRFHHTSSNEPLKAQLLAMMKGMIQVTYETDRVAPQGSGSDYRPAALADNWDGSNSAPESYETIMNGFAASMYAYVGWKEGNAQYLNVAHRLWADGVFYPEYYSPYPTRDPRVYATPDGWGWWSSTFLGSDEKVLSRQTRSGIPYLWVMTQIQQGK